MSFHRPPEKKEMNNRELLDNNPKAIAAFERHFGSIDDPKPDGLTILTTIAIAQKKSTSTPRP